MELLGAKRAGDGAAEHVLGEHVERSVPDRRRVLRADVVGVERGLAFHDLEPVRRHEDRLRGFVHPVIGTADALGETACALGGADVDHEVDVAPVDAEVERRGRHHRADGAGRHRGLHLAPLADIERAVVERDRQRGLVRPPEFGEDELGLAAGVDEDQRHPVCRDLGENVADRIAGGVAGPGDALLRLEDADLGLSAAGDGHEVRQIAPGARALRHEPGAQIVGLGDGGGETDRADPRPNGPQPCEAEREQVAALGGDQRVQLVEDHRVDFFEEGLVRRRAAMRSASCSGVVSRMSGGASFWRWRLWAGVSPVRVSMVTGKPMPATGVARLRSMSTASAFSGEM